MHTRHTVEEAVWRTVCWFAIFEYPLTVFDIWKWMIDPPSDVDLYEVYQVLDDSEWLRKNLIEQDGFYLPAGLEDAGWIFEQRHDRFLNAMKKYKRLRRSVHYLSRVPGVRGVAAVNTLGWWNTTEESDIDMLIITQPDRLWTARFFSVLPFLLMRKRPGDDGYKEDPLCFSFFLSRASLNIGDLCLKNDPYLHYWMFSCVPVFEQGDSFTDLQSDNDWVTDRLPHGAPSRVSYRVCRTKDSPAFSLGGLVESGLEWLQRRRLPSRLQNMAEERDTRVILNNRMLKFHTNDRRDQYYQAWERAMRALKLHNRADD